MKRFEPDSGATDKIDVDSQAIVAIHDLMGARLRETFRAMVHAVEQQFDDGDLAFSHWLALKLIGSGRVSCIGDVYRELGIETGATTRLIDQLEKRGLIKRCRSLRDRRIVGVEITPAGSSALVSMAPRLESFWTEKLGIFTNFEQQKLFEMLGQLCAEFRKGGIRTGRPTSIGVSP